MKVVSRLCAPIRDHAESPSVQTTCHTAHTGAASARCGSAYACSGFCYVGMICSKLRTEMASHLYEFACAALNFLSYWKPSYTRRTGKEFPRCGSACAPSNDGTEWNTYSRLHTHLMSHPKGESYVSSKSSGPKIFWEDKSKDFLFFALAPILSEIWPYFGKNYGLLWA